MNNCAKKIVYWIVLLGFFLVLRSHGEISNENVVYGFLIYISGGYFAGPFIFNEPMFVPYSGEKLVREKDQILRGVIFVMYLAWMIAGLMLAA